MRDYTRLDNFLNERLKDIYPEPFGEPAISIMTQTVPKLMQDYNIPSGAKILDVGCGHGFALNLFKEAGLNPVGIGFGEEAEKCRQNGFEIIETDMSFTDVPDESFDVIWCRHVLEHSLFPFFTLSEMHRLLKVGGVFYMEVPAPETACAHETNQNHYSVLTKNGWLSLLHRTGFVDVKMYDINFSVPAGDDTYHAYSTIRPA
ncbi:Methyltransferase type 11 [Candidatus Terasakiella magnetica]|uniref:Methyltransferase type 11 n=1 Tax=Candidatus Terasakiella magnetica TaxID=1867952 RepID=A0A1C3RD20_9PROT|nr:class I SAM-dependent methyltransferase [Candidatus Terasakiella magnetica]SCA55176.1 Methyltransferase type 11 [Candidatus Terasakiella magnetica]